MDDGSNGISGSNKKMGKTAIDDLLDLDEYDPDYVANNIPQPHQKAIRGGNMRTMLNDNQNLSGMQSLPDDFPQTPWSCWGSTKAP